MTRPRRTTCSVRRVRPSRPASSTTYCWPVSKYAEQAGPVARGAVGPDAVSALLGELDLRAPEPGLHRAAADPGPPSIRRRAALHATRLRRRHDHRGAAGG